MSCGSFGTTPLASPVLCRHGSIRACQCYDPNTYAWQSKVYFDIRNTEELSQPSYGLLNLRLTAVVPETETSVSLWTRNVLNEEFLSAGFSLGAYVTRYYGMPRTFGVTITQSFGGP